MNILKFGYSAIDSVGQGIGNAIISINKNKANPTVIQQFCQVIFSSILCHDAWKGTQTVPKFTATLMRLNSMHNFLGFTKIAFAWRYPINSSTVNTEQLINELTRIMAHHLSVGEDKVEKDAKKAASTIIESMEKEKLGFSTKDHFIRYITENKESLLTAKYKHIDISGLEVDTHTPFFIALKNCTFAVVDLACVPLYLNEWNISLTKWSQSAMAKIGFGEQAKKLGESRAFQWAGTQDLAKWTWGFCCGGYALQIIESVRQLRDENLNGSKKLTQQLTLVSATADLVYCASGFFNVAQKWFTAITVAAKSIGLFCIFYSSEKIDLEAI